MSTILSPLAVVLLLMLFGSDVRAQSRDSIRTGRTRAVPARATTATRPPAEILARGHWPLAGKYSFGSGIGVEYALVPAISVEVNTTFIAHSAKARLFIVNNNISPFVSGGMGVTGDHYGTAGTTGRWIEAQVGIERALNHGFMRIQLHYTVKQSEGLGFPLFAPDFTLGYRF